MSPQDSKKIEVQAIKSFHACSFLSFTILSDILVSIFERIFLTFSRSSSLAIFFMYLNNGESFDFSKRRSISAFDTMYFLCSFTMLIFSPVVYYVPEYFLSFSCPEHAYLSTSPQHLPHKYIDE